MATVDELLGCRPPAAPPAPRHVRKSMADYGRMMVGDYHADHRNPAPWVANASEFCKHYTGTTFIAIGAIAKKVAQQPAKVFIRRKEKSGVKNHEVPPDHPLVELFETVNPIHTQFDLWYQMVAWRLLAGNSYWWKARNGWGMPSELWPLPSQWVWAIPSRERFIDSYLVRGIFGTPDTYIDADDVLHIREPNIDFMQSGSRFYGYPVAAAGATAIDLEESMLRRLYHQFRNFNPPGQIYETEEKLDEDQFIDRLIQLRAQQHTAEQSGDPLLLHSGTKVRESRETIREMDYSQSLQMIMSYLLALYGTPQAVVGVSKDYNRANLIGALISWSENTINPILAHLGQHLTQNLASEYDTAPGEKLVVEFEPVSVNDVDAIRADVSAAQAAGAITPNEVRDVLLKKGPFEKGGDRPMISNAIAPADYGNNMAAQEGEPINVPPSPVAPDAAPPEAPQPAAPLAAFPAGEDDAEEPLPPEPAAIAKADDRRRAIYRQFITLHTKHEAKLAKALAKYFRSQQARVLDWIDQHGDEVAIAPRGIMSAFNWPGEAETLRTVALAKLKDAAADMIRTVYARIRDRETKTAKSIAPPATAGETPIEKAQPLDYLIDLPSDALNSVYEAMLDSLTQAYWAKIGDTTAARLFDIVTDGLQNHLSNPQIAKIIANDESGLFSMRRAKTIARTEVTTAMNTAHVGIVNATNAIPEADKMGLEWLSIDDDDTRPSHVEANGQIAVPLRSKFEIGGVKCDFPGALVLPAKERCNCRCAIVEVWQDDLPEDSQARRLLASM